MSSAISTGNALYIQNGTDPVSHSIHIPMRETGLATTSWTKGHCFAYMGMHYWHNLTADMSCEYFFPAFLLYNKGALTAFGWATGLGLTSKRFEHPPHAAFSSFLNPVPLCLNQYAQLSTMHIYFTSDPTAIAC
ncbi:uncharacterized protein LOC112563953 [Pomacea canaliculata]|uniref:uncharacterized protein LOC112563953 n=1 Tax=Pomacea canaliculata TaxID=400727 RepID=UPI000D739B49|nr:uncharacterized protein LOC112563953 [Pomacea canaliculata]